MCDYDPEKYLGRRVVYLGNSAFKKYSKIETDPIPGKIISLEEKFVIDYGDSAEKYWEDFRSQWVNSGYSHYLIFDTHCKYGLGVFIGKGKPNYEWKPLKKIIG